MLAGVEEAADVFWATATGANTGAAAGTTGVGAALAGSVGKQHVRQGVWVRLGEATVGGPHGLDRIL